MTDPLVPEHVHLKGDPRIPAGNGTWFAWTIQLDAELKSVSFWGCTLTSLTINNVRVKVSGEYPDPQVGCTITLNADRCPRGSVIRLQAVVTHPESLAARLDYERVATWN